MTERRWFSFRTLFLVCLTLNGVRTVFPWIVERLDLVTAIAVFLTALICAVFRLVPHRATKKPEIAYLGPVALAEGARCLICRHGLTGDVIYCGRCHTPHHRACFTYVGGCAIYACGSRDAA